MVAKRKKKIKYDFKPIDGLTTCIAEEVIIKDDSTQEGEWTPTSEFPYMKFGFEKLNPMQSGILKYIDKDVNIIVCSKTASGKTLVIEMLAAYHIAKGQKAMYLSPAKALSNEKLADWAELEHAFADKSIGILTGDYAKSASALKAMNEADINIVTIDMLDSCTRASSLDKFPWMMDCGVLLLDELQVLGSSGRGDKAESALMRFTELNPNARIVMLSATIQNPQDIQGFVKKLNGKETILYESKFRPCDLTKHFIRITPNPGTNENEAKEELLTKLINDYPEDSCLSFVGSKRIGQNLCNSLTKNGIESKFYKADLDMKERTELYNNFNSRVFRSLIGTTAVSAGINLCARRVFVTTTTVGLNTQMEASVINQEIGRSGRPKYEKEGDAYIFLKAKQFDREIKRILEGEPLMSQMHDPNIIAFHTIAEIANNKIKTPIDLVNWYERSLARYQSGRSMELYEAKTVFERLLRCCMIAENPEEMGTYLATTIGKITAMMYQVPENVHSLKLNFDKFFQFNRSEYKSQKEYDLAFAQTIANIPEWQERNKTFVSQEEKLLAHVYFGIPLVTGVDKIALGYYLLLNNDIYRAACEQEKKVKYFNLTIETLRNDSERLISTLSQIDARTKRWGQKDFWSMMGTRLMYGVGPERLELVQVSEIGGARSKQLYDNGIRTIKDMVNNEFKVKEILGDKVAETAMQSARVLHSAAQIGW